MDFLSWQPGIYTLADVMVGRRIADHVALTLSHQRLSDASRKAAALREQATKLELLDALLAALTDTGALRDAIDRISDIAQKVLPHVGSVTDLSWLPDASVDFAFASNVFEHIAKEDLTTLLEQLRRKLSPTGRLCLIQPNYRYCYKDYYDDYTHERSAASAGVACAVGASARAAQRGVRRG